MRKVTDLVSRKFGENSTKKKGPEGPQNLLLVQPKKNVSEEEE